VYGLNKKKATELVNPIPPTQNKQHHNKTVIIVSYHHRNMAHAYDIINESHLIPNVQDSFGRQVRIIHPGYYYSGGDPDLDVLISFQAFDDGGSGIDDYDTSPL
jgi:hypothetical protein